MLHCCLLDQKYEVEKKNRPKLIDFQIGDQFRK